MTELSQLNSFGRLPSTNEITWVHGRNRTLLVRRGKTAASRGVFSDDAKSANYPGARMVRGGASVSGLDFARPHENRGKLLRTFDQGPSTSAIGICNRSLSFRTLFFF